ncbi:MAG: hypothetical protein ABWX96_09975 [Propionibacteriaceae bacterium]
MNAEWQQTASLPLPIVKSWAAEHEALKGCGSLDDVLHAVRGNPDVVLLALLSQNAVSEGLAGRVVLQAMLGKIVRLAQRNRQAQIDDYIAALWLRIGTYPVHRRPHKVAANLALDTLKTVTNEVRWTRQDVVITPLSSEELLDELFTDERLRADLDHNALLAELTAAEVIALGDRLGLLDPQSRDVMLTVYAEGLTGRDAAERHHTTADMVRFRCSRSVRRLADHSTSLAEAA